MCNYRFLIVPALLGITIASRAQDVNEAYNLSNTTVQGTARSMGFGNALGSVGGDFSSLSVNPAGIGIYSSSEFTITPSLKMSNASSEYAGITTSDNSSAFNFNNLGFVFTSAPKGRRYDHRAWKSVAFGIGFNRTADFNNSYTYTGQTNTSSGSQVFESDANKNPSAALGSGAGSSLGNMGYNAYLLNQNASGQFVSVVPFSGGIEQMKSRQTYGGISEVALSLGGNYKEKLLLGITLGLPVVNYQSNTSYQESLAEGNAAGNPSGFSNFGYSQNTNISGGGINAKLGAIYKVTNFLRIGAAFHTPTYYSLNDVSNRSLAASTDSGNIFTGNNQNQFNYGLSTPWKGVLSATFIIRKFGFITADYEYVDYSSMRYMFPGGMDFTNNVPFQAEADQINQTIKKTYQGASNLRLGAEFRLSSAFMVRGGVGYYGNAYTAYGENTQNGYYTTQRVDLSLGAGFHWRHFFTDIALVHGMYTGYEQPYTVDYTQVVSGPAATIPTSKVTYTTDNVALTMGVKFDNGRQHRHHHRYQQYN